MKRLRTLGIIAATALFCAAPLSLHWSPTKTPSLSVDTANAVIGRPLTPGSVAGVNRRVHRRAYYGAQQWAQSVRAFTPTPAAVRFGTQAFAVVGTNRHRRCTLTDV
jgi:hypothetical protein